MQVTRESNDIVLRIPVGKEAEGVAALFAATADGIINHRIPGREEHRLQAYRTAEILAATIREKNV